MGSVPDLSFQAFVVEAVFLGDTAAFALSDGSVRLVVANAATAVQVHSGGILSAASTINGKALVTGGDDGRVAVVDSGGCFDTVGERPRKWIDRVATGPGGSIAYASGRQVAVRLGDGREKDLTLARAANGLAFAPKGQRLAVAGYGGISLWWPATEAPLTRLEYEGAHLATTFAPDGRFVVTSMQENALHAWRISDGVDMHMSGYPAKSRSLAWTFKGRYLASSGAHAAVLWPFQSKDGPMGKDPLQLGGRQALVTRVAAHPRKETVAIGYHDGAVSLVDIGDRAETEIRAAGDAPVSALCFDGRGGRLAFGNEAGAAAVVEIDG